MKWSIVLLACLWSFSSFAAGVFSNCPQALPTNDPGFCASYKSIAECYCLEQHVPVPAMCKDMNSVYNMTIARFGSLQKACEWQKDTSTQNCLDNWQCYRSGGSDSQGRLCSATGRACQ